MVRDVGAMTVWDLPRLVWRIALFLEEGPIFALMCVSKRMYTFVTHNTVWSELFRRMNLTALAQMLPQDGCVPRSLHQHFIEDILTARVLKGTYEFAAAEDSLAFNIQHVQLLVTEASFGAAGPPVGRAQMLVSYRNAAEVLQGALRFSPQLRTFVLCCNTFGSTQRGPVFMVAVAQANRRWANQAKEQYAAHMGGLRLVMTPMIIETITKGSQMTESDIIAVSRPPAPGAAPAPPPGVLLAPSP